MRGISLTLVLLFVVAVGLLFLHRADSSLFETWRTRVVDAVSPVLGVVSWPVKKVREGLENLDDYWAVYKENERLKTRIKKLEAWQSAARHYERQIANYEKLLRIQPQPRIEYITARLIADGGSPFKHTFLLNAGARQGIENGQGVVDGLDLIGRVVNVGQRSSRVLRVTDINSRVPVMVEPSRKRAILAGDNSGRPKLEFVESKLEIQPGDRVVTSGDGGLLPLGLPVGKVVSAEKGKFRVQPLASETGYEIVRVVRFRYVNDVKVNDQEPGADGTGAPADGADGAKPVTAGDAGAAASSAARNPPASGRNAPAGAQEAPPPAPARAAVEERETSSADNAGRNAPGRREPVASGRNAPAAGPDVPAAPAVTPAPAGAAAVERETSTAENAGAVVPAAARENPAAAPGVPAAGNAPAPGETATPEETVAESDGVPATGDDATSDDAAPEEEE